MDKDIGSNAVRLVGEFFVPGASQFVAGNIGSGLAHNLLAGAAGVALIGSGAAPLIGALAILGLKINSFTSASTGRSLLNVGRDAFDRADARMRSQGEYSPPTRQSAPAASEI